MLKSQWDHYFVKDNLNSVIGVYCPDKWVDTTGKKDTYGYLNFKDIIFSKPLLFYCLDDKIEIIKHRVDKRPNMRSNNELFMNICGGFAISTDKNIKSRVNAMRNSFVYPENTRTL